MVRLIERHIIGRLSWLEECHGWHAWRLPHQRSVNYRWREGELPSLGRLAVRHWHRAGILVWIEPSKRYYIRQTLNLNCLHRSLRRLERLLLALRRPIYLLICLLTVVLVAIRFVLLINLQLFGHRRKGDSFGKSWQRVNESPLFFVAMVKRTSFAELAVAGGHPVLARLRLVVGVHGSQGLDAEVVRQWLNRLSN